MCSSSLDYIKNMLNYYLLILAWYNYFINIFKGINIKGFVVDLKKAKNEDMIAVVLTKDSIKSYYRFFGARHSILQVGYLIDFELEDEHSQFMPRLRNLSHMPFSWIYDKNKLLLWHNFIELFAKHLGGLDDIDSCYYGVLLDSAKKWDKQNPKRVICESYIELLEKEGRLYYPKNCYICEESLGEDISLMHSLLPAHPACVYGSSLKKDRILELFKTKSTLYLEDDEIEYLYSIIMKGF